MYKEPIFSIIVPMYAVETYLPKCIYSVQNQTLQNIEIILVDDGSPDRCGEMADEYAARDARIRVIHQANGGLGSARNSGLEIARGEYVGFVDSDDWIEPKMYENLYKAAKENDADIVFTGLKTVCKDAVQEVHEHPFAGTTFKGQDEIFVLRRSYYGAGPERIKDDSVPVSVWIGGYRRSFLKVHSLKFTNVRSEDIIFNTIACRAANSVCCISGTPYCYRNEAQPSITRSFNQETVNSFLTLFHYLLEIADEEPELYRSECYLRAQRRIMDYCRALIGMIERSQNNGQDKKYYINEVLNNTFLRQACSGYPWWKLPFMQMTFYLCERFRLVGISRALVNAKKAINND